MLLPVMRAISTFYGSPLIDYVTMRELVSTRTCAIPEHMEYFFSHDQFVLSQLGFRKENRNEEK